jgi:hypothetical protein
MNDNRAVVADADHELEALAAELTSTAYAVALRHGVEDKWLDLELELWDALKETVKKWRQEPPHFSDVPFVCDWAQVSPKA